RLPIRGWLRPKRGGVWRTRDATALRLVGINPTTIDGTIALLNYFADLGVDDVPPISDRAAERLCALFGCIAARNVAPALERMARWGSRRISQSYRTPALS